MGVLAMTESYKAGDTVRLNSGGALMTVTAAKPDGAGVPHVWTVWHDGGGHEKNGYYPAAAVSAASKPQGPTTSAPMRDPLAGH